MKIFLPVIVLIADGNTREFNLFHIFYCYSYVGFILKKNCDSAPDLSNKENDGRCKGAKPQNSMNKILKINIQEDVRRQELHPIILSNYSLYSPSGKISTVSRKILVSIRLQYSLYSGFFLFPITLLNLTNWVNSTRTSQTWLKVVENSSR